MSILYSIISLILLIGILFIHEKDKIDYIADLILFIGALCIFGIGYIIHTNER